VILYHVHVLCCLSVYTCHDIVSIVEDAEISEIVRLLSHLSAFAVIIDAGGCCRSRKKAHRTVYPSRIFRLHHADMSPATPSPSTPTPLDRLTSLFSASHLETKSSGSSSSSISNSDLLSSPASIAVISSLGTTALVLGGISGYRRYWKRFTTAENVPGKIIQGKKWIKGVVTSYVD
jgi:hypothetical protein